ncbi:MAG: menaquinone biosynthesis protein [Flavobacteriales bacterium]|nr:menaquinone biosynthesis protein [Flavobacteriales bacterium]
MRVKKIKVSAVSYLNTLPFIYGINNSEVMEEIDLSLDIPSDCAKKILSGEVDLGLVPIAILPQLKEYHIISDYCIGAEGKVDSVALYSDVPLNEIEYIYLDYQSRTSINLVQILAENHWKIAPNWIEATKGFENKISGKTAGVIIGDRTFNLSKKYQYKYDLSEEWMGFTGLPFVFACWVSNKELPQSFITNFNKALEKGVCNINKVVLRYNETDVSKIILENYLTKNISYTFDASKQKAVDKFLGFIKRKDS